MLMDSSSLGVCIKTAWEMYIEGKPDALEVRQIQTTDYNGQMVKDDDGECRRGKMFLLRGSHTIGDLRRDLSAASDLSTRNAFRVLGAFRKMVTDAARAVGGCDGMPWHVPLHASAAMGCMSACVLAPCRWRPTLSSWTSAHPTTRSTKTSCRARTWCCPPAAPTASRGPPL